MVLHVASSILLKTIDTTLDETRPVDLELAEEGAPVVEAVDVPTTSTPIENATRRDRGAHN